MKVKNPGSIVRHIEGCYNGVVLMASSDGNRRTPSHACISLFGGACQATGWKALYLHRLSRPGGAGAARIGAVVEANSHKVLLKSTIGVQRILDMASGEQLPRIC